MFIKYKVQFFLSFCSLCSNLAFAQIDTCKPNILATSPLSEIQGIVHNALTACNVPGCAISVVFDNQNILLQGFGTRSEGADLPVSEHTLFPIGSCTKAFTAMALGQLVEEGKMSWDDPVTKYLPEFRLFDPLLTEQITIKDLLAHRSGIARHDPIWFYRKLSRPDIISLLQHLEPAYGLRETFQYNNFMYVVAGMVLERLTGNSWEDEITKRLLQPLQMEKACISLQQLLAQSDFSSPYAEINGEVLMIPFRDTFNVNPAGGINANAIDMANWLKLLLKEGKFDDKTLVTQETLQEMCSVQMPLPQAPFPSNIVQQGYGLGWFVGTYKGFKFINHPGAIDGFAADVSFLPEQKIGIAILANSSTDGFLAISCIRNQIIDRLLDLSTTDWLGKTLASRKKQKLALQAALQMYLEQIQNESPCSLAEYTGCYTHPAYGNFELALENNRLLACFGNTQISLYYKSRDIFSGCFAELATHGVNPILDISFIRDDEGSIIQMVVPFECFRGSNPITFWR